MTSSSTHRIESLDLIKLICAIFVIFHHTRFLQSTSLADPAVVPGYLLSFSYTTIVNVLPVPLFLVISLWLYVSRRNDRPGYFRKRLVRLLSILLIWSVIYAIVGTFTGPFATFLQTPLGYALIPLVDGGLYFLASLILCTALIEGFIRLRQRSRTIFILLAWASLIVGTLIQVYWVSLFGGWPAELRKLYQLGPLIFMFYAPAITLLFDIRERGSKAHLALLFVALYALQLAFWTLATKGFNLSKATRALSYCMPLVLLLALVVLLVALRIRLTLPPVLRSLSHYCLGIYLVHPLWISLLRRFVPGIEARLPKTVFVSLGFRWVISAAFFFLVVGLTAVVVYPLSKTKLSFLIK